MKDYSSVTFWDRQLFLGYIPHSAQQTYRSPVHNTISDNLSGGIPQAVTSVWSSFFFFVMRCTKFSAASDPLWWCVASSSKLPPGKERLKNWLCVKGQWDPDWRYCELCLFLDKEHSMPTSTEMFSTKTSCWGLRIQYRTGIFLSLSHCSALFLVQSLLVYHLL